MRERERGRHVGIMRRPLTAPVAAAILVLAACAGQTSARPSPPPSPSPSTSPSPATASPQPPQRAEASLPAAVEETAAATAGGRLYVMGGFNAAGQSLSSVYVFDGSSWSGGTGLPLALD